MLFEKGERLLANFGKLHLRMSRKTEANTAALCTEEK